IEITQVFDMGGKAALDKALKGLNSAAKGSPWFVLRDLNHDAKCAPIYLSALRLKVSKWMVFRLAVRELEAWLLADREGFADFLGVSPSVFPDRPDEEDDPTQTLVNLARKSKKGAIVRAFVPRKGDVVSVGPGYEASIIEFGKLHWNLQRANKLSPSLRGARKALRDLASRWSRHIRGGNADE